MGELVMAKMTPEQEAAYALDYGSSRSGLSKAAQLVYDRLLRERQEGIQVPAGNSGKQKAPEPPVDRTPKRTGPSVRPRLTLSGRRVSSQEDIGTYPRRGRLMAEAVR